MMLLYGKVVAENIQQEIQQKVQNGFDKKLCTIGFEQAEWLQYVTSLQKTCQKHGICCENIVSKDGILPQEFFRLVEDTCKRQDVQGVMVQQPLPKQYKDAVNFVDVNKDVDCLNPLSVAKLYLGESGLLPATPKAVLQLLDYYKIDVAGKNVVVVGRGRAVGKPLALMLLARNATVTICHTKTQNIAQICKNADIIVSACGVAGLITQDFVTEKSIVVDVGLSFVDGKTCGDVDKSVYEVASAVSPVPGGVGPITRMALLQNLLK